MLQRRKLERTSCMLPMKPESSPRLSRRDKITFFFPALEPTPDFRVCCPTEQEAMVEDKSPGNAAMPKQRSHRHELREALQTHYKAVPTDQRFRDLLERLDQTEQEKRSF
jgi:hypothetical protein